MAWKSNFNSTLFHGLKTIYKITVLDFQKHLTQWAGLVLVAMWDEVVEGRINVWAAFELKKLEFRSTNICVYVYT
jgi:hypothetical protein